MTIIKKLYLVHREYAFDEETLVKFRNDNINVLKEYFETDNISLKQVASYLTNLNTGDYMHETIYTYRDIKDACRTEIEFINSYIPSKDEDKFFRELKTLVNKYSTKKLDQELEHGKNRCLCFFYDP